jgi:hypothetical protein
MIKPTITVEGASYPVLRVFASWPADADLERTLDITDKPPLSRKQKMVQAEDDEDIISYDPDQHPLATLHLQSFA